MFLHPDWSASWTSSSVGLAEGLVEVVVDRIESHPTGVCLSDYCIEVRTIVVHLPTCFMDDLRCLGYVRLEQTHG